MGFFTSPRPALDNKVLLIRYLIMERIKNDLAAIEQGYEPNFALQLSDEQVMGAIEAGIVAIVETHLVLSKKGVESDEIFARIEHHRLHLGRGKFPSELNLSTYIAYRSAIEHSCGPLPLGHLTVCSSAANHFFGSGPGKGDPSSAVSLAVNESLVKEHFALMAMLTAYVDGKIDDDAFYEALETITDYWRRRHPEKEAIRHDSDFMPTY